MVNNFLVYIGGIISHRLSADSVGFWTFALFLATALLAYFAEKQLGGIGKTAKADFIKKFSDNFFNEAARDLFLLIDYEGLLFVDTDDVEYAENQVVTKRKPFPYFLIDKKIVDQFKIDQTKKEQILNKKYYSVFEVDDYLLGPLESIAYFEKRKLLDIRQVYDDFDYYVNLAYDSVAVQDYIKRQQNEEKNGSNIYDGLKYIYEKCNS